MRRGSRTGSNDCERGSAFGSSGVIREHWRRRPLRLLAHRWSAYVRSDDFVATLWSEH